MKMYVANASLQDHIFMYRVKNGQLRQVNIASMTQQPLHDDLDTQDVSQIIKSSEPYGFPSVSDLRQGMRHKFTRLIYSLEVPITSAFIQAALDNNQLMLKLEGEKMQYEAALISSRSVIDTLVERQREGLEAQIKNIELTVQEEFDDKTPDAGKDAVSMGFTTKSVSPAADTSTLKKGRNRK
jgi:hypothetical protein